MASTHNQRGGVCNRPMSAGERSFEAGWRYGLKDDAVELTAREIATKFPDIPDVDAFAQGMLDGLAGDDWRHRTMVAHIRSGNGCDNILIGQEPHP